MRAKLFLFSFFAVVIIVLTGCPYSSEIPLSDSTENFPKEIIGKWLSPSDAEKELENLKLMPQYRKKLTPTYYIISATGKTTLEIKKFEFQSSDSSYTVKLHQAHTSSVGNFTFLNIKPEDESKYYLYRMEFESDKLLNMHPVTDYIVEKFDNSAEMKSYFNKYKELSFFYSGTEKYVKM